MKQSTMIVLILWSFNSAAQDLSDFINQNAISLKSDSLFEHIKDYKCLMIGEMHGTQEAAVFMTNLVKLSSKQGKRIILGLEIPASDMTGFIKKQTTKNLKKTRFFKQGYGDGRNNEAWFRLIKDCKDLKNVEFCFFDVDFSSEVQNRDSIMFANLAKAYRKDTTKVIYTLSGNIHNKTQPFRGKKTLGCYMAEYLSADKIMSINHLYGAGTMYNNTGEGLKIRAVKGQTGIFASSTNFENYFLPRLPDGLMEDYSAIFYTSTITASIPLYYERP